MAGGALFGYFPHVIRLKGVLLEGRPGAGAKTEFKDVSRATYLHLWKRGEEKVGTNCSNWCFKITAPFVLDLCDPGLGKSRAGPPSKSVSRIILRTN